MRARAIQPQSKVLDLDIMEMPSREEIKQAYIRKSSMIRLGNQIVIYHHVIYY